MKDKIIYLLAFLILLSSFAVMAQTGANKAWPIITRKGDLLMEGNKSFRFFGLAAPNIQQNESQINAGLNNRFPDDFEIRDILNSIQRLGGRATRTFSLSISSPDDKGMPVYATAKRSYNEAAFRCLDRVIALAHEYDVRLIVPFIASQSFGGIRGVDEFAVLSGKAKNLFWTDESVKADFKHLLNFILNRKNTVNGVLYKDDPAILCWQLGNEFGSFAGDRKLDNKEWSPRILAWSLEMAAYIKKADPNHLVMDAGGAERQAFIDAKDIDIISEHLYEYWNRMGGQPWELSPIAMAAREQCKGKKPLIIDEFGLGNTANLTALMKTIRENGISGGLMWSIRGHRRDGGWYYHNEGGTTVNSFHVPGFSTGFVYEETRLLDILRRESFAIRGESLAIVKAPSPAPLLIQKGNGFTWRGSTGASGYTIERLESGMKATWNILATGLEDAVLASVAEFESSPAAAEPLILYYDETRQPGKTYQYRIKGTNVAGQSGYSNIVTIK